MSCANQVHICVCVITLVGLKSISCDANISATQTNSIFSDQTLSTNDGETENFSNFIENFKIKEPTCKKKFKRTLKNLHVNYERRNENILAKGYYDDDVLYCSMCNRTYLGDCPIHGPKYVIENKKIKMGTPNRAKLSCSPEFTVKNSSIPNAGLGVWSTRKIPARTRYGPYEGIIIGEADDWPDNMSYMWVIYKDEEEKLGVDAIDPTTSNCIRYVNTARNEEEINMTPYQLNGQIYYMTTKIIPPNTELLVWYGREYADELGIDEKFDPPALFDGGIDASKCPVGWLSYQNHCYMFASESNQSDGNVNWYQALNLCRDQDAYLAGITSCKEMDFIMNNKPSISWEGWIGFFNVDKSAQHISDSSCFSEKNCLVPAKLFTSDICLTTDMTYWKTDMCKTKLSYLCERPGKKVFH